MFRRNLLLENLVNISSCKEAKANLISICKIAFLNHDQFFTNSCCHLKVVISLLLTSLILTCKAQDDNLLKPVTTTYAITNCTIIQKPGVKIENGNIVIKEGIIDGVGRGVNIPSNALVIKGDSMYVYAGFIDGLSQIAVEKRSDAHSNEKITDPGNPPPLKAGISPQADVRDFINDKDHSIKNYRCLGFTVAHVVPQGNFLPGQGAIIMLQDNSSDAMILRSNSALYSEFSWNNNIYPSTVIGFMAKWRELYRQAELAKSYQILYAENSESRRRPINDRVLESFYPVIDNRLPVLFRAEKVLDIERAVALKNELKIPQLILGNVKEGWYITDKLKSANAKIFLSLDLPKEYKETNKDSAHINTELAALREKQKEIITRYESQASELHKAGIPFGFSTLNAQNKCIKSNLRRMIKGGLSEDDALASLTTIPAEMLGLSEVLGTIDKGKIANLILTNNPYFDEKSKVVSVFVDGILYNCQKSEAKPSDSTTGIEGSWSLKLQMSQDNIDLKVFIKKENNILKGSINGGKLPEDTPLTNIAFANNKLTLTYSVTINGETVRVSIDGTTDNNWAFRGEMTVGEYGKFPIEGSKDPK